MVRQLEGFHTLRWLPAQSGVAHKSLGARLLDTDRRRHFVLPPFHLSFAHASCGPSLTHTTRKQKVVRGAAAGRQKVVLKLSKFFCSPLRKHTKATTTTGQYQRGNTSKARTTTGRPYAYSSLAGHLIHKDLFAGLHDKQIVVVPA